MWKLIDSNRESFVTELEITDEEYNQLPELLRHLYSKIGNKPKTETGFGTQRPSAAEPQPKGHRE